MASKTKPLLIATLLIGACAGYDASDYTIPYLELGLWPATSIILILALLLYAYKLHSKNQRLQMELIKSLEAISSLRKTTRKLKKRESELEKQASIGVDEKKRIAEGIVEIEKIRGAKSREEQMKSRYWDRIEKTTEPAGKTTPEEDDELDRLEEEQKSIEETIELTRVKYNSGLVDEGIFKEMIRGYQKQLIEIEAKMREIREKKNVK